MMGGLGEGFVRWKATLWWTVPMHEKVAGSGVVERSKASARSVGGKQKVESDTRSKKDKGHVAICFGVELTSKGYVTGVRGSAASARGKKDGSSSELAERLFGPESSERGWSQNLGG